MLTIASKASLCDKFFSVGISVSTANKIIIFYWFKKIAVISFPGPVTSPAKGRWLVL